MQLYNQDSLGFSVYLSNFGEVYPFLESEAKKGTTVFTSLHISEEFSADYVTRAKGMLRELHALGYQVMADVSKKTVVQFNQPNVLTLARELGLWALRLDYGFSLEEMLTLAKEIPIAVNASTIDLSAAQQIQNAGGTLMAFHNFYPRPETGLGDQFFRTSTQALQQAGIPVYAFIQGDGILRGPLHEGLPTLERHRNMPPLAAYVDLLRNEGVDRIFVGDCSLSPRSLALIRQFEAEGVLPVPARLAQGYESLYGRVFTSRPDSPAALVRFQESREYSCFGETVEPLPAAPRALGCITVDNKLYGRYSGEVQLMRAPHRADERVNVIGAVLDDYLGLLPSIHNGSRFMLVEDMA